MSCMEIDGEYHENLVQMEKDKERSENLIFNGLKVIRFTNSQVENNIKEVLNSIEEFILSYNDL